MKQTLLIADGDTELCELYGEGLTDLGYDVVTSSDGLDCLTKLRQAMPDAIVLDLELLWAEAMEFLLCCEKSVPCT